MKRILLLITLAAASLRAAEKPNVVFILADDLGIGDTKCYGGDRCLIDTPNIDALAAGGLRFTDAHPSASVCGPTRRAIMTGRYEWRFGPPTNNGPWGFCGPRPGTEKSTLGKVFKRAGYQTGYIGKWHLGTIMPTFDGKTQGPENVDYSEPLSYGPQQLGFEQSFILPGSLDMFPYAFAQNHVWQGEITAQKGWSAFNRIGPAAQDFEDHEVLETFYQEAEAYIAEQNAEDPFFLFLALTGPHTPISPGVKWRGKSTIGVYGDFVMEVDHSVERVMKALKKQGLDQNTLVLFSSDHGAACYAGNILKATPGQIHLLEEKGHYPNGPYRGYKFCVYEGGLRVPLIAHWPAVIRGGTTSDALVGLNDFMATFAELSGVKLASDEAVDSVSFASVLRDPKAASPRRNLIMQSAQECFVVRDGDWKLCLCPGSGANDQWLIEPLMTASWKKALASFGRAPTREDLKKAPFVQLFDLATDVHEDHNVAADHPDLVAAMVSVLAKSIDEGRSTPGPTLENDKRGIIHQRLPDFVGRQVHQ
ncbi:MAG: arylsulfatase [Verrucomicrobiales bacterium]|nr:arylsulfatase [Verrucomicrobiales bacterium]